MCLTSKYDVPIPFCLYPGNFAIGLCEVILQWYYIIVSYMIVIRILEPSVYVFMFSPGLCRRSLDPNFAIGPGLMFTGSFGVGLCSYMLMYYSVRGEKRVKAKNCSIRLCQLVIYQLIGLSVLCYFYYDFCDKKIRNALIIFTVVYAVVQHYIVLWVYFNNREPRTKDVPKAEQKEVMAEDAEIIVIPLQ